MKLSSLLLLTKNQIEPEAWAGRARLLSTNNYSAILRGLGLRLNGLILACVFLLLLMALWGCGKKLNPESAGFNYVDFKTLVICRANWHDDVAVIRRDRESIQIDGKIVEQVSYEIRLRLPGNNGSSLRTNYVSPRDAETAALLWCQAYPGIDRSVKSISYGEATLKKEEDTKQ